MAKGKKIRTTEELRTVAEHAESVGLKSWELAGLTRAAGWTADRQVGVVEFGAALDKFRNRLMGGGKI